MTHLTFNAYHLGDNLVHLHFLRKMAARYPEETFAHWANPQHVPQLMPLVEDVPNLTLLPEMDSKAINAWRGDGGFFYGHPHRNDFVKFHLDWFGYIAGKMGLESPIQDAGDMLFDYPALERAVNECEVKESPYDFLVINSFPHSGQLRGFNPHSFEQLIHRLNGRGYSVVTTYPAGVPVTSTHDGQRGLSVTAIGGLSVHCRSIVGVATGPIWTTFNIWNRETPRIIMLDDERIFLTPNTRHVRSCEEAEAMLLR